MSATDPIDPSAAANELAEASSSLAQIPLFSRLDEQERRLLVAAMKQRRFLTNETVFWIGDRGDSLFLIISGRVSVSAPNEQGEHVPIATLGPGELFGEISLLDGGPRTATVRAAEPLHVYTLNQSDFQSFLVRNPHAALDILSVMGARQRLSTEALRHIKNPNVEIQHALTPWQRASDTIATVAAGQWFTLFHITWFGIWIGLNLASQAGLLPEPLAFDPYPFGLLTMVVSLEAIFLSIFVMVSQNRQAERDRVRADLDYQVNVKAHTEILAIAQRLDRLESAATTRGPSA
ncbi:MAG: DUF1003 domain-containing protein [Phycisphaerae bacterium]|nr:DUF1003 domain-containing protein [Phycisphaerae bacterium]